MEQLMSAVRPIVRIGRRWAALPPATGPSVQVRNEELNPLSLKRNRARAHTRERLAPTQSAGALRAFF